MDGQYPWSKLPDPQGALSKRVPSSAIFAANSEALYFSYAAGAKVRGAYLKMSAKKAELQNWKASSRAWSTSHNSLLRLSLASCKSVRI